MFNVTLVNLSADARSAVVDKGRLPLGKLEAPELTTLLETFLELDPIENSEADPEIIVETRREKYLIRTDHKNLFLYNIRKPEEPAYKLPPTGIIAELDGSAERARTTAPFPLAEPTTESVDLPPPIPPPAPRKPPFVMATITAILGVGALLMVLGSQEETRPAAYRRITDPAERSEAQKTLVGVYMTGSKAGHHGIAVAADGAIKIFQVNHQVPPSVVHDNYQVGHLGANLCLLTDQPGGLIEMRDRETLIYCGESYRRIP